MQTGRFKSHLVAFGIVLLYDFLIKFTEEVSCVCFVNQFRHRMNHRSSTSGNKSGARPHSFMLSLDIPPSFCQISTVPVSWSQPCSLHNPRIWTVVCSIAPSYRFKNCEVSYLSFKKGILHMLQTEAQLITFSYGKPLVWIFVSMNWQKNLPLSFQLLWYLCRGVWVCFRTIHYRFLSMDLLNSDFSEENICTLVEFSHFTCLIGPLLFGIPSFSHSLVLKSTWSHNRYLAFYVSSWPFCALCSWWFGNIELAAPYWHL